MLICAYVFRSYGATRTAQSLRFFSSVALLLLLTAANTLGTEHIWVTSTKLPAATAGIGYSTALTVRGGHSPYNFSISSGALPPGLSINSSTGLISGTPSSSGKYGFNVEVRDTAGDRGDKDLVLYVGHSGISITISPTSTSVVSGATKQFTAYVTGTGNTAVNWFATGGSLNSSGLFVAPTVPANTTFRVTATSVADSSKSASAQVTVTPPSSGNSLSIVTTTVPDAASGVAYSQGLSATGGSTPYIWSLVSGTLPAGITLSSNGTIAGTSSQQGQFTFTVRVTDAHSATASQGLTMQVTAQAGSFDGPAELPRVYLHVTMADTPAPGNTINVPAGSDLQAAINNASCGDTIKLQAGATFPGKFWFPSKPCDDAHWIILRTSAPDTSLPPEGTRLTPCYAGVTSLPGRPSFNCTTSTNVLAKIVYTGIAGDGPIKFETGANHYRFTGLEITRGPVQNLGALMAAILGAQADKIVVDRSWLHGDTHADTSSGIHLSHMTNVAVVDSFFTDFHCAQVCIDSHAVGGGGYDRPGGPFKIVNNFLEASGENIMFGGAAATATPTDIEIRRNHLYKPMIWKQGQPGFIGNAAGKPFVVKNHFELKNAQRVLFEANILENVWGGFTQNGFTVLLTPKNQAKLTLNVCPVCQVTDVTIRYSTMAHMGAGLQISTGLNGNGAQALAGARYSIHDITMTDIRATYYNGSGIFAQVTNTWPTNPLHDVTINHVTAFADPSTRMVATRDYLVNPPMWGLVFTNNALLATAVPIAGTGGGALSCSYGNVPKTIISTCFRTYSFTSNALIATPSNYPPANWPSGNYFPASMPTVQFANYSGGNYQLLSSSPYAHAGTDGKDIGADVAAIQAAIAGVN